MEHERIYVAANSGKKSKMSDIMYYKIIGPIEIKNPTIPPDSAWVGGMDKWALGAIVEFVCFTAPLPNVTGARVSVMQFSVECKVRPKQTLKRIELPYDWLEPLPNYCIFSELPGRMFMGNNGKMIMDVR